METPPRDPYGAPPPGFTEALRERQANVTQSQRVHALLEELYTTLLRRGVHAEVTVNFTVVNGVIQADIHLGVVRHYRAPAPEE